MAEPLKHVILDLTSDEFLMLNSIFGIGYCYITDSRQDFSIVLAAMANNTEILGKSRYRQAINDLTTKLNKLSHVVGSGPDSITIDLTGEP